MPYSFIKTDIDFAYASIEFSMSSLTTEAGLSTTSPAAIFPIRVSESILILLHLFKLLPPCRVSIIKIPW